MSSLFELTTNLAVIEDALAGGFEDTPEGEAQLAALLAAELSTQEALEQKAEAYASIIGELEALASARKAEADRIRALADTPARQADRMRLALKEAMERLGMKKLATTRYQIGVRGNGGKQPLLVDEMAVTEEYTTTKVVVDKDRIRTALEAGATLPFAILQPRGTTLTIK
jgi:hypothetical protein